MTITEFTQNANDWNNHIFLLWLALEETKTGDVIEMGCGDGSTRQLHKYCKDNQRVLFSFDWDKEWFEKFRPEHETINHRFHYVEKDWSIAKQICQDPTVILVDHSPGERRVVDIRSYCDIEGILVIHDTQPPPTAANYGFETIWRFFKHKIDLTAPMNEEAGDNRTWASAVSNTYDLSKWKGLTFGEYVIK